MFSTAEALHEYLQNLAEPKFAVFSAKLIPGLKREMMGIRVPTLRNLAKEMVREDAAMAFQRIPSAPTHEEVLLLGFLIGYARLDWEEWKHRVTEFVPLMDNWAVCDMVCTSLTVIRKHRDEGWDFLQPYLQSPAEFDQRFGTVMLMEHFLTTEYVEKVLSALQHVHPHGYYAAMAIGWALQAAFVQWPERVFPLLENAQIDRESRKLARKKILESLRTPPEWRNRIKALKL